MSGLDPNDLTSGNSLGTVYPPVPGQRLPDKDARTHSLERLREYICSLIFTRTAAVGEPPIAFMLKQTSIHVYQPDDIKDLAFPSIAFVPGRGSNEPFGLGPPQLVEGSLGSDGMATVRLGEYIEDFIIEVVASKQATRRAIVAGLQQAMRLSETSYSLRLTLPNYHDLVAQFTLGDTEHIDDMYPVQNRRRTHLHTQLRVCEVAEVPAKALCLSVELLKIGVDVDLDC